MDKGSIPFSSTMKYREQAEYSPPAGVETEYRTMFNTHTREWVRVRITTTQVQEEDDYFIYSHTLKNQEEIMAKVNFTKEHYAKMKELAFEMLINNDIVTSKLGQTLTIADLLHTQTINTLNGIRLAFGKQIETLENQDEWVASDAQQERLEFLKRKKELVNLIIGWKRHNIEVQEAKAKKAELNAQLKQLKESQKTPEDKIKEIEEQLKSIDADEDF